MCQSREAQGEEAWGFWRRTMSAEKPGANISFWHPDVLAARLGSLADPETVDFNTPESDGHEF